MPETSTEPTQREPLVIVGAGIGGLAAALACTPAQARNGIAVQVFERANAHVEYGAGIQMGPNVTRVLRQWGLLEDLRRVACAPAALQVRDAADGRHLAQLRLGADIEHHYGAPYWTVHRGDLLQVLVQHVAARPGVEVHLGNAVQAVTTREGLGPELTLSHGTRLAAAAVIGADGVGSVVRQAVPARRDALSSSRHIALRALVPASQVDADGLLDVVSLWLGPHHHVVMYSVQAGAALNVVVCVNARRIPIVSEGQGWAARLPSEHVQDSLARVGAGLCDTVRSVLMAAEHWGVWPLTVPTPVQHAAEIAHGHVALLGDAAHPTLPYLAQGAGMAIEDAAVLARCLGDAAPTSWPQALQRYAALRLHRCARIQRRANANGRVFHARGLMSWGRDLAMAVLRERLLDLPWLYGWDVSSPG